MTNVAFKLQDSGFTREQVEALTDFMASSVATKGRYCTPRWQDVTSEIASGKRRDYCP